MRRRELRQRYPAHHGDWCGALIAPRIQPQRKPLTFWHVLGGIAVSGLMIIAAVSCVMAALRGLGAFHA